MRSTRRPAPCAGSTRRAAAALATRLWPDAPLLPTPGTASLVNAPGAPVEERGGADEIGPRLQGRTARGLGVFLLLDRGEMPVGQHRGGQRPEVLSRLQ